ncbi:MAG TPA: TetR/AcrR family transcriptional regulator [Rugosimonospora sp.]|nr:TetR/AcrR family transcriptional regulator [Rugosimonospora sp.]
MAARREQTVQRILDGAATAFAKGGFAGTSMEEIAASAGVSKLLLYRDFAGKRELYQAVLDRTLARVVERVSVEPSSAQLRELIAVAREDPDGFVLAFWHAAREPEFAGYVADMHRQYVEVSDQILRSIEPDPALRRWAAEMTVSITYQSIITWLEHGTPERDDEFYERLLSVTRAAAKGAAAAAAPAPAPSAVPAPAPAKRAARAKRSPR